MFWCGTPSDHQRRVGAERQHDGRYVGRRMDGWLRRDMDADSARHRGDCTCRMGRQARRQMIPFAHAISVQVF